MSSTQTKPNHPDPEHTSESEEMYLITIARAAESGATGPVPVAAVAKQLEISVASANEMVRRLARRDLLTYEPYRGAQLTTLGATVADRVLRTRRLWATFLADHLGFTPTDADNQACDLEHVTTAKAADRLASFLGDPATGPLGRRIPDGGGSAMTSNPAIAISGIGLEERAEVLVVTGPDASRSFLASQGIAPGTAIRVKGIGEGGMLIETASGLTQLSTALVADIEVRRKSP